MSAPVLLVSNNHYELDLFSLGERERLDEGLLHIYAAHGVLRGTWEERTGTHFVVTTSGAVEAAIDGEPATLEGRIEFRILPGALRLLLPRPDEPVQPQ